MTPAHTPWPPDEGAPRVPDPGLTLVETVNVVGVVNHFLNHSRAEGDAVLESAREKLREVAHSLAMDHPAAYDAAMESVEMEKRFGLV